jgi:hypothetical protein
MSTSGEEREHADELLARFVDAARTEGFDRALFEALHPAAAAYLEEVLRARPRTPPGAPAPTSGAPSQSVARAVYERLTDGPRARERYRTEEEVSRGGRGAILRVWAESLGRFLAMKVTHASEPEPSTGEHTHVTRSLGRVV